MIRAKIMFDRIAKVYRFSRLESIKLWRYIFITWILSSVTVFMPFFLNRGLSSLKEGESLTFLSYTIAILGLTFISESSVQAVNYLRKNNNISKNYDGIITFCDKLFKFDSEEFLVTKKTGAVHQRVSDRLSLNNGVAEALFMAGSALLPYLIYVAIIAFYSVPLGLVILGCLPLLAAGSFYWMKIYAAEESKRLEKLGHLLNKIWFFVDNFIVLRILGFTSPLLSKLYSNSRDVVKIEHDKNNITLKHFITVKLLLSFVKFLCFGYIVYSFSYGKLSVADLLISLFFINASFSSLDLFSNNVLEIQRYATAIEKENEFLFSQKKSGLGGHLGLQEINTFNSDVVTFKDVTFGYKNSNFQLEIGNLILRKNKTYAVVGRSGSGKSTLVNLIMGVYGSYRGRIELLGSNISNISNIHKYFSLQPQTPFLFDGPIINSLLPTVPSSLDSVQTSILFLAKKLDILHLFINHSNEFDLYRNVSEGEFSQGELHRLSLMRSLLQDKPLYIFDEPSASLDNISEVSVMEAIKNNVMGRCCILIAHRMSTIKMADEIIVMDSGKIVEVGPHAKLMANKLHYFKLVESAMI